ncbi:MAG: D-alanyl-D-alanine carboxypeptidase [Oscillospiraceae bacterium]|nr:D-alanyl-D-alanine carboxypeptidase [Oscillospiraceae bacterium]
MKKPSLFCLCCFLALAAARPALAEPEGPAVSAASAIVLEPRTGTVLYEKAPDERMLVASTTKLMTALVVLEHCPLDDIVVPTAAHAAVEGSSMLLKPGERYTVEELLYGLLLASGNDAAAALADHCAGGMEAFAALMNDRVETLGLQNTHFANSHGLDAPEHYSSARDLAAITAAAMENPVFCRMFASESYTTHGITYYNHNRLLGSCPGCVGGKTGYTRAAGRVLVSVVEREGMRLICVTISDPDDWADHAALYDAMFARWRYQTLPAEGWARVETLSGTQAYVRLDCDLKGMVLPKDSEVRLKARLPRFVYAPVMAGERAGSAGVYVDGALAVTAELRYGETVSLDRAVPLSAWERFRRVLSWSPPAGIYYLTK